MNIMDCDHTAKHCRKNWCPDIFDRRSYGRWMEAGGKDLVERTAERVAKILEEHKPELLPDEITRKIKAIVDRAENQVALEEAID
jgi:trimethylamine--corrinoid protein Co-methyltransferase